MFFNMPHFNRNKLLKINAITSLFCQIITLVCGFILPRLIIDNYGSAVNGLIASITQFLGIIALCEFGMGAVVPASLYKPLANKDNDQISKVVISSERFYRKIAIFMLVYVVVLTICYPLIIDGFSFLYTASLIIIIASCTFAQYYFGITYSLLIAADQSQYITYILNSITIIVNLILSYIFIQYGYSIHVVKLLSSIVFICRPLFYVIYVKKHYIINKKVSYRKEPIRQKWNGVAQHIAYTVQEKTGFMILSFMATLEEVSIYSVYFLIMEGVRSFIYSITSSLTSFLGNIIAKDERETLISSFNKIEWSLHNIIVLLFSSAAILVVPFIKVYTIGICDANYIVPIFPYVICAAVACRCLQLPYNIVVQAAGHFKETQNSAILEPVIDIVLSILLVTHFGLIGVAIGMLVSIFYRMMYLSLYLTSHILYISKKQLFKRLFVDFILSVSIFSLCSFISLDKITYFAWIVMAVKVVGIAIIVTIFVNVLFYKENMISLAYRLHLNIKCFPFKNKYHG